MSEEQTLALEKWLLEVLKDRQAARTDELVKLAAEQGRPMSPAAINWAVWHLVSSGKLQITPEYLVKAG
jgi:hypothetical protein